MGVESVKVDGREVLVLTQHVPCCEDTRCHILYQAITLVSVLVIEEWSKITNVDALFGDDAIMHGCGQVGTKITVYKFPFVSDIPIQNRVRLYLLPLLNLYGRERKEI